MRVTREGHRLLRLFCAVIGHDLRQDWPGNRTFCARCDRRWGKWG